jgi:hypothetical protein
MKEEKIIEATEVAIAEKQVMMVFDEDSGQNVKVTKTMRDEALAVHSRIQGFLFEIAQALYEMQDKKLYLGLGFNSFKEYYTSHGFSKTKAFRYASVGGGVPLGELSDEKIQELQTIGIKKLYELTRLTQEQVSVLISGCSIEGESGEVVNLQDFKNNNVADVSRKVSSMLQSKDKKETNRIKADNELLKAEKKALIKRIERMDQEIKDARELEARYGPVDRTLKAKKASLSEATNALGKFYTALNSAGIEASDPPELIDMFAALVASIERHVEENRGVFWQVINEARNE